MKKISILLMFAMPVWAQPFKSHTAIAPQPDAVVRSLERPFSVESDGLPFDPALKPFYHGVASGDPTESAVIIWTRVTPDAGQSGEIKVKWFLGTDINTSTGELLNIIKKGETATNADRDYTVKIDVTGLQAGKTYYYGFEANGSTSLIGRTKTTPKDENTHLRFAVVSCSNYEAGYFNAYMGIGERNDLDAVIHLGDYIYEYGKGTYGNRIAGRSNIPDKEILTLADYRTRYSLYRLDAGLRRSHQQHPFIAIWDDHESANDSYKDGAQNHQANEGSWEERKAISKRVYSEWMPIRGNAESIYRTIKYGNLAELIMLDTRLEGREAQINDVTNPALYAPTRTLLGAEQKKWFFEQLRKSKARWKIIGNQVIFSEFNVGWAAQALPGGQTPAQLESQFLDIWDGYPVERDQIIDTISLNKINNVVILTGDFHTTFAFDVAKRPSVFGWDRARPTYNPATGEGSVAVEFAVPSVTSANFDENLRAFTNGDSASAVFLTLQLQSLINNSIPGTNPPLNPNPHMKYTDLIRHGYLLLNVTNGAVQGDYFFVNSLFRPEVKESFGQGWYSFNQFNRLQKALAPASNKAVLDKPTPTTNKMVATRLSNEVATIISAYPNPTTGLCLVNFVTDKSQNLDISVFNTQGQNVRKIESGFFAAGNYALTCDLTGLDSGMYVIRISSPEKYLSFKVILK